MRVYLFALGWALACALPSAHAAEVLPDSSFESTSASGLGSYSLPSTAPCDDSFFYWLTTGASGNYGIIGYNGELGKAMPDDSSNSAVAAELERDTGVHFTLMLDPQLRLTLGPIPPRLAPAGEDSAIPEPSPLALMAAGLLALAVRRRGHWLSPG